MLSPSAPSSIAFGPIESRRLGHSLGINNIPPKHCTYDCAYCQVGPTRHTSIARRPFFDPEVVIAATKQKVMACRAAGIPVDHLSFVPDGEPTLDISLGAQIRGLAHLGIPVAVITNGSLLWLPEVRDEVSAADVVSVEVDAADVEAWRRINRACPILTLPRVLDGIATFARSYRGRLMTQTMLLDGVNDDDRSLDAIANFLGNIKPAKAWLTVPTRPTAERSARGASNASLARAYAILSERVPDIELLMAHRGGTFYATGDPLEDLLAAVAVHPMPVDVALRFLTEAGGDCDLHRLVREGRASLVEFDGTTFLAPAAHSSSTTTAAPRRQENL